MKITLNAREIGEILGVSETSIRIHQSRGNEGSAIPPSTKLHGRRVWLQPVVDAWIQEKIEMTLKS